MVTIGQELAQHSTEGGGPDEGFNEVDGLVFLFPLGVLQRLGILSRLSSQKIKACASSLKADETGKWAFRA
jgi:hypothetical protein